MSAQVRSLALAIQTRRQSLSLDGLITQLQEPRTLAILATVIAVLLTTRLLSGTPEKKVDGYANQPRGAKSAPVPGYWIPWVGHAPQMAWDSDGFQAGLRSIFPQGIFALRLLGRAHTLLYNPSLMGSLLTKPNSSADGTWLSEHLLRTTFMVSKSEMPAYKACEVDLHAQYKHLLSGATLGRMVQVTAESLRNNIADLVSFNTYYSDQMEWERLADASPVDNPQGERCVEVELDTLLKNFVATTANSSLYGTDFSQNFPDAWQHVWTFDEGFLLLATGLPSLVPWPRMQRARIARRKLYNYMCEFHEALDKHLNGEEPGARWQDLDNISHVIRARAEQMRKYNIPISLRAKFELGPIWAMNANSSPLVFWMVYELFKDKLLLEQVRDEIAPYVRGVEPRNEFGHGVWIAPQLERFDVDGLMDKCPLLKSTYIETLRVYTGGYSVKYMRQDVVLREKGASDEGGYLLKKGSYAHVPMELHQLDPVYFPNAGEWQGARHVKETVDESGKTVRTADMSTLRPYGKLSSTAPSHLKIAREK